MARFKFRLDQGVHAEPFVIERPNGINSIGHNLYYPGSTIETDSDLRCFNTKGTVPRFVLLEDKGVSKDSSQDRGEAPSVVAPTETSPIDDLEGQTVAQLKELAEAEEIDLSGAPNKGRMIEVIRTSLLARSGPSRVP